MRKEVSRLFHNFLNAEIGENFDISCLDQWPDKNHFFQDMFTLFRKRYGKEIANTSRNRRITYFKIKRISLKKNKMDTDKCLQSSRFEKQDYGKDDVPSAVNYHIPKFGEIENAIDNIDLPKALSTYGLDCEQNAVQSLLKLKFNVSESSNIELQKFHHDPMNHDHAESTLEPNKHEQIQKFYIKCPEDLPLLYEMLTKPCGEFIYENDSSINLQKIFEALGKIEAVLNILVEKVNCLSDALKYISDALSSKLESSLKSESPNH